MSEGFWMRVMNEMGEGPLISIVDDDESVRESLPDLLRLFGFTVQAFASGEEFLASDSVDHTKCLVLDIAMPGMSGPDLQQELVLRRRDIQIIFITALEDEMERPLMDQHGTVACLLKPFSESALLDALTVALPNEMRTIRLQIASSA